MSWLEVLLAKFNIISNCHRVRPEVVANELAILYQLAYSGPSNFQRQWKKQRNKDRKWSFMTFPLHIWNHQIMTFWSFTLRLGEYRGRACWKDFFEYWGLSEDYWGLNYHSQWMLFKHTLLTCVRQRKNLWWVRQSEKRLPNGHLPTYVCMLERDAQYLCNIAPQLLLEATFLIILKTLSSHIF
jgi:hypothetical protein